MKPHAHGWKVLTALVLLCACISAAHGASIEALYSEINKLPPQQRQKRLKRARKSAFKLYGISAATLLSAYTAAFMKKYPFIKAEFWRGSGNKLVFRTLTEHRTNQLDTDAVLVGTENVMTLKRSGIWARYHSPESVNFGKEYTTETATAFDSCITTTILQYQAGKKMMLQGYDDLFDQVEAVLPRYGTERALMGWLTAWGQKNPRVRCQADETWDRSCGAVIIASQLFFAVSSSAVEIYPTACWDESKRCRGDVFPTRRRRISAAPPASTSIRPDRTPPRCSSIS